MFRFLIYFFLSLIFFFLYLIIWGINKRKFVSSGTVASAYDSWTQINYRKIMERAYSFGFYPLNKNIDFREAKVQFVHELVSWSGLDKLPRGSRF